VTAEYALRFWFRHVKSSGNARDYFAQRHQPQISRNSLGYREREPGPKDPNRYRIAVVGDSFTFGQGIEASERFSNLVEGSLGPRDEVLNFGVRRSDIPTHPRVVDPL